MSEHNYEKLRGQLRHLEIRLARVESHLGLAPPADERTDRLERERTGRELRRETRSDRRAGKGTTEVRRETHSGVPVTVTVRQVKPGIARPGAPKPPAQSAPAAPSVAAGQAPAAAGAAPAPDVLGQLVGVLDGMSSMLGGISSALGLDRDRPTEPPPADEPSEAADPSGDDWMAREGVSADPQEQPPA